MYTVQVIPPPYHDYFAKASTGQTASYLSFLYATTLRVHDHQATYLVPKSVLSTEHAPAIPRKEHLYPHWHMPSASMDREQGHPVAHCCKD